MTKFSHYFYVFENLFVTLQKFQIDTFHNPYS